MTQAGTRRDELIKSILYETDESASCARQGSGDSLLSIICSVREDTWIDAAPNVIYTVDNHTVFIGVEALFIEQAFPLGVEELAAAMSNELVACPLCRA